MILDIKKVFKNLLEPSQKRKKPLTELVRGQRLLKSNIPLRELFQPQPRKKKETCIEIIERIQKQREEEERKILMTTETVVIPEIHCLADVYITDAYKCMQMTLEFLRNCGRPYHLNELRIIHQEIVDCVFNCKFKKITEARIEKKEIENDESSTDTTYPSVEEFRKRFAPQIIKEEIASLQKYLTSLRAYKDSLPEDEKGFQ